MILKNLKKTIRGPGPRFCFMKNLIYPLLFIAFLFYHFNPVKEAPKLQSGDILFISSGSGQGKAIQLATHSKYTHVGVVFLENGVPFVYHAVEPVQKSTLAQFLAYSADGNYTVKRLKDKTPLTAANQQKMCKMAQSLLGKHYDIYFDWKDDEWYCSEFVWKLYDRNCKVRLGELKELKEYDLSSPVVKGVMEKRYGDKIPYNEKMVSPQDIFNSSLLEEVGTGQVE